MARLDRYELLRSDVPDPHHAECHRGWWGDQNRADPTTTDPLAFSLNTLGISDGIHEFEFIFGFADGSELIQTTIREVRNDLQVEILDLTQEAAGFLFYRLKVSDNRTISNPYYELEGDHRLVVRLFGDAAQVLESQVIILTVPARPEEIDLEGYGTKMQRLLERVESSIEDELKNWQGEVDAFPGLADQLKSAFEIGDEPA